MLFLETMKNKHKSLGRERKREKNMIKGHTERVMKD